MLDQRQSKEVISFDLYPNILDLYLSTSRSKRLQDFVHNMALIVMYSNSAVDPIIYSLRNKSMRLAVKRLLTCWKPIKIHPVPPSNLQNRGV